MIDRDEIIQEIQELSTIDLLYLLDNISAQILEILIERGEKLEQLGEATH